MGVLADAPARRDGLVAHREPSKRVTAGWSAGSACPLAGLGCQKDGPLPGCTTTAWPRTASLLAHCGDLLAPCAASLPRFSSGSEIEKPAGAAPPARGGASVPVSATGGRARSRRGASSRWDARVEEERLTRAALFAAIRSSGRAASRRSSSSAISTVSRAATRGEREAERLPGVVDPVDVGLLECPWRLTALPSVEPEEDPLVPEGDVGERRGDRPAAGRGARQVRVAQALDQGPEAAQLCWRSRRCTSGPQPSWPSGSPQLGRARRAHGPRDAAAYWCAPGVRPSAVAIVVRPPRERLAGCYSALVARYDDRAADRQDLVGGAEGARGRAPRRACAWPRPR